MAFEDKTSVLNIKNLATVQPASDNRSAVFIVLTGSQAGRFYKVDRDEMVIGRSGDVALRFEDDGVSRKHARVIRTADGSVAIADLGSTNGTFCNGERVSERQLQDGDKIQIGTTTILKFSYQDSLDEDFQRRQYESATRDVLTGCFNKKYFLERLPAEITFAARHGKSVSLAMFDIDHFKKINDTHGHPAGDAVLRVFGKTLIDTLRSDDVVARYGGEEFALIMRETPLDAAFIAVERIRRRVEGTRFEYEGKHIPVTTSCGVATCVDGKLADVEALIKAADSFLYKAKTGGRNRTECALLG